MVNRAAPDADATPQTPLDEPPGWPPALIEAIQERGQCYLVADVADADRMTSYGLLTLAVPTVELLTLDLLKPVKRLEVLQRPREDDTVFGVAVKRRLLDIGWRGEFNRARLFEVQADTAAVERDCGGDRNLFATTILGAFDPMLIERLRPPHRERQAKPSRRQGPRPVIITMDHIERQPIEWLWWPYLAFGKIAMLDGDPGIGKGLLTIQLAANLSRAYPLPDQQGQPTLPISKPRPTLLLTAEDGLADTLKARLEAAGADCAKIHVLTGWLGREDEVRAFTLQHMDILEQALKEVRPGLLIIDPIQAYVGDIDIHRSNATRPLLTALKTVIEPYHCASVCVRHPGKGQQDGKALYRGLGTMDFIGAARTGLFAEQHPLDPNKALLAHHKSNIGPLGRTQVYSKDQGEFRWVGVSRLNAEVVAGSGRGPDRYAFLEAVYWLEGYMRPGLPYKAKDLEEALSEEGFHAGVMKRAKKALGIVSTKQGEIWYWKMPDLPVITPP
jgi:hypothetical protein